MDFLINLGNISVIYIVRALQIWAKKLAMCYHYNSYTKINVTIISKKQSYIQFPGKCCPQPPKH